MVTHDKTADGQDVTYTWDDRKRLIKIDDPTSIGGRNGVRNR